MADAVGNRLGPRGTFVYESDTGVSYNISLDRSVSEGVNNVLSTNGNLPVLRASQRFPLCPRYILLVLESDFSVTKKVIIGDIENGLFQSNAPSVVAINGVNWIVTTRAGERRAVLKLTPAPPEEP